MRILWCMVAIALVLVSAPLVQAQTGINFNLPSNNINTTLSTLGLGYTTASRFMGVPAPTIGSFTGAIDISVNLMKDPQARPDMSALMPGPGFGPLMSLKFRTIDSLNFDKRARFAKLRETVLALEDRIRQTDQASVGQVNFGFRQFMFPLPLVDQPSQGYGFFSQVDLVGVGGVSPELFLSPFTQEVQESLGEKKFLEAAQALLFNRTLPQGMAIDQFYDTQLAAMANFLFSNGRFAGAAQAWAVLAERDPGNPLASRGLAISLLAGGDPKKAAAELRRSLALMKGWPDKVKIIGSNFSDVFPKAQDVVGIKEEIQAQLAKQPNDPDLGLAAAFVDLFQGNLAAAEERLTPLAPADEVAKNLLALIKGGAVAETVKHPAPTALRQAASEVTGLEEAPLSPEARAQLIAALQSGGGTYEDPMRLGDFRFFMGDFSMAEEAYRKAHKDHPQDAFALFALAHSAIARGEYVQATRYLTSGLAIETNWGLYDFRLQEFYGDRAEYLQDLKNLERQVQMRPRSADLKFLLAYVYYFSGRYADAADLLAEVVRLDPKFEPANYFLRLARLQG